jgi:hypothetical protein
MKFGTILALGCAVVLVLIAAAPVVDMVSAATLPVGVPRLFGLIMNAWWLVPVFFVLVAVGLGLKALD